MRKQTDVQKVSNKYAATGVIASAAFIAAQPLLPLTAFAANQYEWIQQEDIDTSEGDPTAIAMSASGSHLILGGEGNLGLYISDDSGATWENVAEEVDPDVGNWWTSVDVSNDGEVMVATSSEGYDYDSETWLDGKVFISEDAGDSWNEITPADTDDWADIAVSGDGTTIAAGTWDNGNVYISENDGEDWTTSEPMENGWSITAVSISDNGNKILAGGENGEDGLADMYLSENTGDTWVDVTPNAEDEVYSLGSAMSADGNELAVTSNGYADDGNDAVFVSTNDGADWTDVTPDDGVAASWWGIGLSDDGETLAVQDGDNRAMHVSRNFGTTWAEEDPTEGYEDGSSFIGVDFNTDGTKAFVATENEAYLGQGGAAESETENTVTLDSAGGGKTIVITTPEGTTITCHSAVKESGLSVEDMAFKYPLGLVDFCFSGAETNNQVSLLFVTDLKADEIVVRKYNPDTEQYTTVDEAEVTETTYEGDHAIQITYNIVDNGPLDTDPDVGEVADPVGLGISELGAPNTGFGQTKPSRSISPAFLVPGVVLVTSLLASPIREKISKIASKK